MLNELVNHLRGQVRVRAECAYPERVLNLCSAWSVSFWDLQWESPTAFTCRMGRRDWHTLKRAAGRLDAELSVVKKEGVPYFLRRFRRRTALVTGLTVCGLGLFLGSFFIWDFRVEGNRTVPEETILRALEKNGVGIGAFGLSLDGEDIRNHVLLDVPELCWIAVNVSGCRATVQVRERVPVPERRTKDAPSNVTARIPGLVLEVRAYDGAAAVLPGTAVTEGQLLISGVEDTGTVGTHLMTGRGKVTARTWHAYTVKIPLTETEKVRTGETKRRLSLVIGGKRIKFFRNSSIADRKYDKITVRYPVSLLGIPLPVTAVAETYRFYDPVPVQKSPREAEKQGEALLTAYLHTQVDPWGTVESTLCASRQAGDVLEVTLRAECVEEIGETTPVYGP